MDMYINYVQICSILFIESEAEAEAVLYCLRLCKQGVCFCEIGA